MFIHTKLNFTGQLNTHTHARETMNDLSAAARGAVEFPWYPDVVSVSNMAPGEVSLPRGLTLDKRI